MSVPVSGPYRTAAARQQRKGPPSVGPITVKPFFVTSPVPDEIVRLREDLDRGIINQRTADFQTRRRARFQRERDELKAYEKEERSKQRVRSLNEIREEIGQVGQGNAAQTYNVNEGVVRGWIRNALGNANAATVARVAGQLQVPQASTRREIMEAIARLGGAGGSVP